MRVPRSVIAALAAAAVAAAIAVPLLVTGGDKPRLTKPQYSARVWTTLTTLAADFRRAGPGRDNAQISSSLKAAKAAADRAAARIDRLRPPADGEREHRALVAELRDYAAQIDLVRASVDFGDPATIIAHLQGITAPRAIKRTIRELDAKGYDIPIRLVEPRARG